MTVNEYLWKLEWLKVKRDHKYEKCIRKTEKANSPRSSLDIDGMPHRTGVNTRELQLIEVAEALEKYYAASDEYEEYRNEVLSSLSKLDYNHRIALEHVYVWELDREPQARLNGLCQLLDIRKGDLQKHMSKAKAQLKEILLEQGKDIE